MNKTNEPTGDAELRNIVEASVRHARANVGFTFDNHEAAEANISMNIETIMVAVAVHLQAAVEEAKHSNVCWEEDGHYTACDRLKNHKGSHSWQLQAAVAEAQIDEQNKTELVIYDDGTPAIRVRMLDGLYGTQDERIFQLTQGDQNG